MRLSSLLTEERILVDLPGQSLAEGVDALVGLLAKDLGEDMEITVRKELIARRTETCDYLGSGVALPHVRMAGLNRFYLCMGNSIKGLTLDGPTPTPVKATEKAHLIFLILTPQTQITLMLQTLAAIARLCYKADMRRSLMQCKNEAKILRLIEESNLDVKRTITASDAMRRCEVLVAPEDDLALVLKKLVKSDESALPVVDGAGALKGVITPTTLFQLALPKYFNLLSDVDFLNNFEPFEQILLNEKKVKAGEIASSDVPTVPMDAPILQVAHLMTTKPTSTVFVVNGEGRLEGTIHETDILAKVLMP